MTRSSVHPRGVQRGYTLGTLFLLTSACAALLAIVAPLIRSQGEEIGSSDLTGSVVAGGAALGTVGMLVGLFHYARFRGVLLGLLVGSGLGAFCGPLVFVPAESFSQVLLLAAGGAALLLSLAAAIRLSGDGWRKRDLAGPTPRAARAPGPRPHPLDPDENDH